MKHMPKVWVAVIILILTITAWFFGISYYPSINTIVVDAETSQPIEGAVILAEWTKEKGMGHTSTESFKVVEALTDKDGKATIKGLLTLLVPRPEVTVYKKGYVAWNNERIFPTYEKRTNFKWKNGYVFRLERFKEGVYKHCDHSAFIYFPLGYTPTFNDAVGWEWKKCREE